MEDGLEQLGLGGIRDVEIHPEHAVARLGDCLAQRVHREIAMHDAVVAPKSAQCGGGRWGRRRYFGRGRQKKPLPDGSEADDGEPGRRERYTF
jgi:hypothetical protein